LAYKRISPIPVNEGGSGALTLTGILTGNGTSAFTASTVTQYGTVVASTSNLVSSIAPSATSGIPYISQGSSANPTFGTAVVAGGGTGDTSFTAYAVITGGTTSTGALQNVSGVGSSGQVLTSSGAGALPVWSTPSVAFAYTAVNAAASPYTVLSTDYYLACDVTAGTITIRLPNAPTTKTVYIIKDKVGLSATNNITVTTVGGTVTIDGATTFVMNTAYQAINVLFDGSNYQIY
jgi:hypothetical protein